MVRSLPTTPAQQQTKASLFPAKPESISGYAIREKLDILPASNDVAQATQRHVRPLTTPETALYNKSKTTYKISASLLDADQF